MPVPKVRKSRQRTRQKKAASLKFAKPALTLCSHCGQPKKPHTVCSNCGYYRGRQVKTIKK